MEKSKRNTTMLIIITIAVFLVVVLGATFAYFATERNIGSAINAGVETAGKAYQFTATSNGNIEMNIAFNEMSEANVSNTYLKTDNASIDVSLASPNNDTLSVCTYDIVWVWDSSDMYTESDVELPYTHTDNKIFNNEFSIAVDNANEIDISNLSRNDKKVTLKSGISIISTGIEATTKKHDIAAYIYNLPVEQTNLFNKSFKAHVTVDNLSCEMKDLNSVKTIASYIKEDVYTGSNPNGTAGLYFHASDTNDANYLANGAADDTYRYAGADADVNNYICFAGDECTNKDNLYRIISVDSTTNQTKVIKATSLGNMKWNEKAGYTAKEGDEGLTAGTSYTNIWAYPNGDETYYTSSLNDYLNGEYLTSLGDKTNKIEPTTWSVGGASSANYLQKKNVKGFMDVELNNSITYSSKIGLMYVSEYGFAALPEYWTNILFINETNGYNLSKGKNWMLTGTEWTISRNSDSSIYAFYVASDGFGDYSNVISLGAVRPTFSLKSNIKIASGSGQESDPYIIFSEPPKALASYIKEDVYTGTNPNGTAGLYFHTSDSTSPNYLASGAADDTYRYSGADADVNNFVCFQGDDCSDENNLYRIISVDSDNQTKVIKATSLGNMAWNSAGTNTWEGSSLETYLNGTYLTSLGNKASKIETTTWNVGDYTWEQHQTLNAKQIYDIEMAGTPTINRQIGLMYISEYEFAALPECWTLVGYNDDATKGYQASKGKDWILTISDYYPWTISRNSAAANRAFLVDPDIGHVYSSYVDLESAVRPSFVLSSDVKITNAGDGVGTKTNPMIIE